jgi:hypothetical protein
MVAQPAIVLIIAKIMALTDWIMENFVSAVVSQGDCNTFVVTTNVLSCGEQLGRTLEGVIVNGANLLNYILAALGAIEV